MINDLILTELLPLLIVKNEKMVIDLLKMIKKHHIHPDWEEIRDYQVSCLKSGSSGIGIPDILIAQNCIQNNVAIYSNDKLFKFMQDTMIGIELYL